ncbi:EamA family transporter [Candidatus Woesearchaeota archaeon]|nr:EamA family transporter [Candidatus Woesearchaeota archaeon]
MATTVGAMALVLISCVTGSFGALYLKKAAAQLSWSLKSSASKHLVIGVGCYGVGMALGLVALRFGDLSVIYPLTSTAYIWITLLSKYQLREDINLLKTAGICSIIIGVSLIGLAR